MPNDIDRSLLDRLQALRGSGPKATSEPTAPVTVNTDVIERTKTPSREDALAARLKSLRDHDGASPSSTTGSVKPDRTAAVSPTHSTSASEKKRVDSKPEKPTEADVDEVDAMFSTDDKTLEELLGDVGPEDNPPEEPSDEQVRALLEELSKSIPNDTEMEEKVTSDPRKKHGDGADDSDDSDGENMQREMDDVIAKFRDEAEVEAALGPTAEDHDPESQPSDQEEEDDKPPDFALPTLPSNLEDLPSSPPRPTTTSTKSDIDDITARMAALRAPTTANDAEDEDSLSFPSVPSLKPSSGDKPIKRLTSKTNYTDDDVDSWCTVCLEDATLQCLGCDNDVYCTRCWREMHIGPSAAFDERSHKAVRFTKAKKKEKQHKVALGA